MPEHFTTGSCGSISVLIRFYYALEIPEPDLALRIRVQALLLFSTQYFGIITRESSIRADDEFHIYQVHRSHKEALNP